MHELPIARDLLAMVEANLEPGDARIVRIFVEVGSAAAIVPESLCFAFRIAAAGTRAQDAELSVTTVAARSRCVDCGMEFEFEGIIGECPRCGRVGGELLSGREMILRSIEVADV